MKKYFYCAANDMKKAVCSHTFLFSVFAVFVLCFSTVACLDHNGREYSVLEVILDRRRFSFMNLDVIQLLSISRYLTLFLPILSAMPFVAAFSAERLTGNIRFHISRIGRYPYYMAKFTAAFFSGGCIVLLGYALYAVVLCVFFPLGNAACIPKVFCGMFLYGMVSVTPAFFFAAFIRNKYIVCCLPFILLHFYSAALTRFLSYFTQKGDIDAAIRISFLYPDSVEGLTGQNALFAIAYQVCLAVLALAGFVWIMDRRGDYGE